MNKYEIRTNKKKESILHSALELFGEKGFTAVTIKEIASRAGVSQVSIYNYFSSKEALVGECVQLLFSDIIQQAKSLLMQEMRFRDKLIAALSLCNPDLNKSLYQYFSTDSLSDAALQQLMYRSIHDIKREIYREYIELGKREQAIDESISTSTILDLFEAINIVGQNMKPEEIETKQIELQHLLLHGLLIPD